MAYFKEYNDNVDHPCTIHVTSIPMHNETVDEIRAVWEDFADYLEIWKPHNWAGQKQYREGEAYQLCFRPFGGPVQIQADGKMIPCCFMTDAEVVLGDTYKHKIKEILEGAVVAFQEEHLVSTLDKLPCKTCDQRFSSEESPLLYSNRDSSKELNRLSTSKMKLGGK
jgi:radical SAM protein with 4Fe4S-binding SPASM domain